MRQFKASTFVSLVVALGCSACTASDKVSQVKAMQEASVKELLVAGVQVADDTTVSSEITFYVSNNSNVAVRMLIWNTPLESELSADVFTVTLDGMPVAYQGRMVKRSSPSDKDYLIIPAHERVESQVDMAVYYAMSEPGEYQVRFTPATIDGQARLNEQTPVQLDATTLTLRIDPR